MKYLLDTHTLIWTMLEPEQLSERVRSILESKNSRIFVSVISFWEIATKITVGKMNAEKYSVQAFIRQCAKYRFTILPVVPQNTISYFSLPLFKNHRDPFDRMLIAIAVERGVTLLSRDTKLPQYDGAGLLHIW
jgi:PIN domain nuclease of toxin-antitoxin system